VRPDNKSSSETAHLDAQHRCSRAGASERRVITAPGVAEVEPLQPGDKYSRRTTQLM
jgi:hypothetical protein